MTKLKCYFTTICIFVVLICFAGCNSNNKLGNAIDLLSSDDPDIGFWMAIQSDEICIENGNSLDLDVAFGFCAHNSEKFEVIIETDDFNVEKSCPDVYIVDGIEYTNDDFYCFFTDQNKVSYEKLPQTFKLNIIPKGDNMDYVGTISIKINAYQDGGYSTIGIDLYYYGNSEIICFSSLSNEDAINNFESYIQQ